MANENIQLLAAALIIIVVVAGAVLFFVSRPISNIGTIKGVGIDIFSDAAATIQLTQIDWGILAPNATVQTTIYVKNTQNSIVTLTYQTSNWIPVTAPTYITLSWSYVNTQIQPLTILPIIFTLHISPNIIGITNFSFQMTLNATAV